MMLLTHSAVWNMVIVILLVSFSVEHCCNQKAFPAILIIHGLLSMFFVYMNI